MSSPGKKRPRSSSPPGGSSQRNTSGAPVPVFDASVELCSTDYRPWKALMDADGVGKAVEATALKKPKAAQLLRDLHSELGKRASFTSESVASASAKEIHEAMCRLVQYKLTRGAFRPGLLQQFQGNPAATVKESLRAALAPLDTEDVFELLVRDTTVKPAAKKSTSSSDTLPAGWRVVAAKEHDMSSTTNNESLCLVALKHSAVMTAIKALSDLKGVGPATSTIFLAKSKAVLPKALSSAMTKSKFLATIPLLTVSPFMADESMKALGVPLVYTPANCTRFLAEVRRTQMELVDSMLRLSRDAKAAAAELTAHSALVEAQAISEALWASLVLRPKA